MHPRICGRNLGDPLDSHCDRLLCCAVLFKSTRVGEQEFWRNYFSHVAAIVTEGQSQHATGAEYASSAQIATGEVPAAAKGDDTDVAASATGPVDAPAASATVATPSPVTPKQTRSQLPRSAAVTPTTAAAQLAGLHINSPSQSHQFGGSPSSQPQLLDMNVSVPAAIVPPSIDVNRLPVLRWGVVGCGSALQTFTLPALLSTPGARVVAVTCRTPSSRESFAAQFNLARSHASLALLLADPEVDAVYLATPPGTHLALAGEVAAAGKPCVLEKCMARNGEECRAIMEAFQAARVPLYVNQHKRLLPRFIAVQQMLRLHVGSVQSIHYQLANDLAVQLHESGSGGAGGHPPNWRVDAEQSGGGLFMEFGSELFGTPSHHCAHATAA